MRVPQIQIITIMMRLTVTIIIVQREGTNNSLGKIFIFAIFVRSLLWVLAVVIFCIFMLPSSPTPNNLPNFTDLETLIRYKHTHIITPSANGWTLSLVSINIRVRSLLLPPPPSLLLFCCCCCCKLMTCRSFQTHLTLKLWYKQRCCPLETTRTVIVVIIWMWLVSKPTPNMSSPSPVLPPTPYPVS